MKKILFPLILLVMAGCASAPIERALPSAEISNILNAKVYLIIEKEDLQTQIHSSTAGKDFGLIGMFLDS